MTATSADVSIGIDRFDDALGIRRVHESAFGQAAEARLVDDLRADGDVRLSLLARTSDGEIVGHVLMSTVSIVDGARSMPALALAPVGVVPAMQRRGVGSALIRAALDQCRRDGHRIVFVLGDPTYYGRFGFTRQLALKVTSPYDGEAFQALELVPGAMDGIRGEVRYPAAFG